MTIKDEVLKGFWVKARELNDTFVSANAATMCNPNNLAKGLENIRASVVCLITYADSNKIDIACVKTEYNEFIQCWDGFVAVLKRHHNKPLTRSMQIELGTRLQNAKEANERLIVTVRKNITE